LILVSSRSFLTAGYKQEFWNKRYNRRRKWLSIWRLRVVLVF